MIGAFGVLRFARKGAVLESLSELDLLLLAIQAVLAASLLVLGVLVTVRPHWWSALEQRMGVAAPKPAGFDQPMSPHSDGDRH